MKLEFDEISPFSKEKTVLVEAHEQSNVESRICLASGYTTRDNWTMGSDIVQHHELHITELMRDTKYEDEELGTMWYLSTMSTPAAMLYPAGSANRWAWEVAPVEYLIGEDRKKYPIPGKVDEYYTSRLATEKAENFETKDFKSAMDHFYKLVQEHYEEPKD
jgi:hypothetical protein